MTITVDWDSPNKTVIRYQYVGKWTWDEYKVAVERAHELARSVDYTVDVIADFSKASLLPENALSKFRNSWESSPVQFGTIVIVTGSVFVERMAAIFQRINSSFAGKFKVVRSLDDARVYIVISKSQVKHR